MSSDTYDSLTDSEQVIWQNEVKTDFFRKREVEVQKITNLSVYQNDVSIPLYELEEGNKCDITGYALFTITCLVVLLQNRIANLFSSYLYHADQASL
jgi:hypothetical protein